jgi:hypothetical protein
MPGSITFYAKNTEESKKIITDKFTLDIKR